MTTKTANFSNLLAPGLRKVWFDEFKGFPEEYSKVFNMNTTKRHYEDDYEMTMLGGSFPAKPEGESIQYVDPKTGSTVRYTPATFGMGFRVTEEMYEDDLYNVMNKMSKGLAKAQRNTIEYAAAGLWDDAFTGALYTGFDGHCLCNTAHHILFTGATQGNKPPTDVDLSMTSLQAGVLAMESFLDQDGVFAGTKAKRLVIAPDNKYIAREILKSEYKPYTAGNEINALMEDDLSYFVWHFISDTDNWALLGSSHDLNFFWRRKPRFDNSDDFDTGDAKYKATHRSIQGFGDWRGVYGSSGG